MVESKYPVAGGLESEYIRIRLVTKTSEIHFRDAAFSRPLVIPMHTGPSAIETIDSAGLPSLL